MMRMQFQLVTMYLNLIQIAESFGVSEKVVEGWIRDEGLPGIPDRGRLLFDRAQVAEWADKRGLAAQAGFLAPAASALAAHLRIGSLLRIGGVWRDVAAAEAPNVFERIVTALPGATPPVRQLLSQRLRARGGVILAPIGGGFALPHPGARITLGRDSGTVALFFLRDALSSPNRRRMARPSPGCVSSSRHRRGRTSICWDCSVAISLAGRCATCWSKGRTTRQSFKPSTRLTPRPRKRPTRRLSHDAWDSSC